MSLTLNRLNTRIRDINNKLIRLNSWEYTLRCPVQVKTTLWIILVQLELEKYSITNS
jgi:hypothetical protein